MFNPGFEKKVFLGVVTAILLTGILSVNLAYASSADVFAGLAGCAAEYKQVFATQNDVYIFGSGLPNGNYYVRVTTTGGTILGTSSGTVNVSGGTLACTHLISIVFKQSNGSIPGWDESPQNISYKIKISEDPTFPNGKSLEFDGFKVASGTPSPPGQGSITLVKNVDNSFGGNAGENDFGLTIGVTSVTSGQILTLDTPVDMTINEAGLQGYEFVDITGDAKCPTVLGGTISLEDGDDIICTITNREIAPKLTIVKDPTNDDGGNAQPDDFLLTVGGNSASSGVSNTYNSNTPLAIDETQLTGYEFVSIAGDPKCPDALGGTITLDEGDDITCTITNDDIAPCITLTKNVVNNPFGIDNKLPDDFDLTINGNAVSSGVKTCDLTSNSDIQFGETLLDGFEFVEITGDAGCPSALDQTFQLDEGENLSCTIKNQDIRGKITVHKFYDANTNGLWDQPSEPELYGWKINVDGIVKFTFFEGLYLPDDYVVFEYAPIQSNWKPTTPTTIDPVTVTTGQIAEEKFGNVCTGPGGGLSKGFWTNKNGQALINDNGGATTELALLSSKNLRNAAGADFNPADYAAFKTWLGSATATNMAYMLSAQYAAMVLNVEANSVSSGSLIYAPELALFPASQPFVTPAGFITINDLLNLANTELGLHGSTPAGNQYRAYQEALKNVLDRGDNNIGFVQATPCPFSFAP